MSDVTYNKLGRVSLWNRTPDKEGGPTVSGTLTLEDSGQELRVSLWPYDGNKANGPALTGVVEEVING
jgi:hypothetical protein